MDEIHLNLRPLFSYLYVGSGQINQPVCLLYLIPSEGRLVTHRLDPQTYASFIDHIIGSLGKYPAVRALDLILFCSIKIKYLY